MIGIAVAAVAASFGAVRAPDRADASCMEIVVWRDVAYAVPWNPADLPPIDTGRHLRGAVEPDCADTGGPAAAPTPVQASSIDGVPPSVAIWAFGGPLIASGYFPEAAGVPDSAGRPCGRRRDGRLPVGRRGHRGRQSRSGIRRARRRGVAQLRASPPDRRPRAAAVPGRSHADRRVIARGGAVHRRGAEGARRGSHLSGAGCGGSEDRRPHGHRVWPDPAPTQRRGRPRR